MPSTTRHVCPAVFRPVLFATAVLFFVAVNAPAQFFPPNELSVGLGVLKDLSPSQLSGAITLSAAWDWDEDSRSVLVLEGEIGAFSEDEACQLPSGAEYPDNCFDAAVLAGLRFRPAHHVSSGRSYFVTALVGEYWKGSGLDGDQEYGSSHFAVQIGGGIELRWPNSIQGMRLSVDYRHVFAGDLDRNQFRVLSTYTIGPRRFLASASK